MKILTKAITKEIANQLDKSATSIQILGVNENDDAVFCNLYNGESLLVSGRVYSFATLPCLDLTVPEKEYLDNQEPNEDWTTELIQQWFDDGKIA